MSMSSHETRESNQSLWMLTISPTVWAVHFMLCYVTAAVWCAKFGGRDASLTAIRLAIAGYTVVALIAIGLNGWGGWRRHRFGTATPPHDRDTPEDRHRFLGFATVLLSALSLVAVIFQALVAVFFEDCR